MLLDIVIATNLLKILIAIIFDIVFISYVFQIYLQFIGL